MYCHYYPEFFYVVSYPRYMPIRQFPPVDPNLFNHSAKEMRKLMNDTSIVLDRLADSIEFSEAVMNAAQESNQKEVERLIESTGISSNVGISFTPDNLHLEFKSDIEGRECCILNVAIRWR